MSIRNRKCLSTEREAHTVNNAEDNNMNEIWRSHEFIFPNDNNELDSRSEWESDLKSELFRHKIKKRSFFKCSQSEISFTNSPNHDESEVTWWGSFPSTTYLAVIKHLEMNLPALHPNWNSGFETLPVATQKVFSDFPAMYFNL